MTSFSVGTIYHPSLYILITLFSPSLSIPFVFPSLLHPVPQTVSVFYLWLCSEHRFDQLVVHRGTNNPTVNVSDRAVTSCHTHCSLCSSASQPACGARLPPQVSRKLVSPFSFNKGKSLWGVWEMLSCKSCVCLASASWQELLTCCVGVLYRNQHDQHVLSHAIMGWRWFRYLLL